MITDVINTPNVDKQCLNLMGVFLCKQLKKQLEQVYKNKKCKT